MDSSNEKLEIVPHGLAFAAEEVDVAAQLAAGSADGPLDPEVAARLRRKIDLHLLPLMCIVHSIAHADKFVLSQAAVLGIMKDARLSHDQYNWLGTVFFIGYFAFTYPHTIALQRLPVAKWISLNIFIWSIALLSHAACTSFGGLFVARFILGACEGSINTGFMIITAMFYTRHEQTKRVGYWYMTDNVSIIALGFLSFGVAHTTTHRFAPWKWLVIITGLATLVIAVIFWLLFPDSPANSRFLTPEERVLAVQRIKVNQAGIENKHWKKEQFTEALKDLKTWLLAICSTLSGIMTSYYLQRQLIVNQFGFTVLQSTLLGCMDGIISIIVIFVGVNLAAVPKFGRAYTSIICYTISTLGAILVQTLPVNNKFGLLFSYWLNFFALPSQVIRIAWTIAITAGHTKRTTVNALILIGFSVGSAAGPLMWKEEYTPRNHVPWSIIAGCNIVIALIMLALRILLSRENKQRDKAIRDEKYDNAYVQKALPDGSIVKVKVDKTFLDLSDKQNRDFRYVL